MKYINIVLLYLFLTCITLIASEPSMAEEIEFAHHKISLEIKKIEDPSTIAVSLITKSVPDDSENDIDVNLDILLAAERNLNEKANGEISINQKWNLKGEEVNGIGRRNYHGLIGAVVGIESSPRKEEDNDAGDWEIANGNIGLKIDQHIPFTRIRFPWSRQESWPLILGSDLKYIFDATGSTNDGRGSVYIDWELPLVSLEQISAFLGGRGEWYWLTDGSEHNYAEGRLQISLPTLFQEFTFLKDAEPLVLVKYIDGSQPPEFDDRNEWHFGIGTQWIW